MPKVLCMNTFFYKKLSTCGAKWLAKWTKKINIFEYDKIFIPVHLPGHWVLGVVDFGSKVISYWDSMKSSANCAFYENLRSFLKEESVKRGRTFLEEQWLDQYPQDIPKQDNAYDCGMFVCMFAEFLSRGDLPTFKQDDMPSMRRKVHDQILQGFI
ncbi:sentrin-specific protease-like [Porites lutea]|uniref:sentrin-specific protease-like n=1 Tax=Porites lutea TaxID=51062 RepID=UPI003CC5A79D